jgi:hypothetical protein
MAENMNIADIIKSVTPELKTVRDFSIDGKIKNLKKKKPGPFASPSDKRAYAAKLSGLEKLKRYMDVSKIKDLDSAEQIFSSTDLSKVGDTIKEEPSGAIATSTIGSTTIGDGEGGTKPAPFGSSAIFAKSTGTVSRRGYFPPVDKKKKKKVKEFVEFYNQE